MGTELGNLLGGLGQQQLNNALGNFVCGGYDYSALQNQYPATPREPSFAWMWLIPVWTILSIVAGLLYIR